jgi:hypothetical protein
VIGGVVLNEATGWYVDPKTNDNYVRVSDVLREFGYIDARFFDEESRTRGHAVHLAIKLIEKGTLDEESLDPIIIPWIEGYRKFKREVPFKAQYFEQPVCNRLWRFAGTLDLFGMSAGDALLIDVKTGNGQKAHRLQTGAYEACVEVAGVKRYVLELGDGDYNLVPHVDKGDSRVFLGLAAAWWWNFNNGLIKRA